VFNHVCGESFPTLERRNGPGGRIYDTPLGPFPSITTVLSRIPKPALKQWEKNVGKTEADRVRGVASRRGTRIHGLFEDYLNNKPIPAMSFFDRPIFDSIQPILDKYVNNIQHQECHLYSKSLGVAGQVDCIADFDGVPSIIDFKTASSPKRSSDIIHYFLQKTFYSYAYEEMSGIRCERIVTIIAVDFDQPQIFIRNRNKYRDTLLDVIKEYGK
jgi:hypothetical protein